MVICFKFLSFKIVQYFCKFFALFLKFLLNRLVSKYCHSCCITFMYPQAIIANKQNRIIANFIEDNFLSQTLNSGGGFDQGSPPGSPSAAAAAHYRRSNSREESAAAAGKNVFSRLIAGTNIGERQGSNKGVINPYQGRISGKSPLICSNVAEGHNRPVLSVFATEDLLFSASKDQTVKVSGSLTSN
jgi:hypothetical protein